MKKRNIELLAPAGSLNKMKYALHYGADAVYAGVPDFSLRARINAFDIKDLKKGVELAHKMGKKFYVTLNIYAHNTHLKKLEGHLKKLKSIEIDGIILSDPGILLLVKEYLPKVEIHLSTQANATNWQAVKFWASQRVSRVVLAREVTLAEIKEIKKNVPEMELEYFVHGAMCMSYSGRCILSKWISGRSANLGDCSQPCRWAFNSKLKVQSEKLKSKKNINGEILVASVEENKGEFEMDLEEDGQGTHFFNSKDLNLLDYLGELMEAGVDSFKIEGRNKSVYYLATVIRAYRNVIDALLEAKNGKRKMKIGKDFKKIVKAEQENLGDLVNRGYTTGFLLGTEPEHNFANSHNESEFEFVGEIVEVKSEKFKVKSSPLIEIRAHNAIYADDDIEIIGKKGNQKAKILNIYDDKMQKKESAHGGHGNIYYLELDKVNIEPMALIRKKIRR